MSKPTTIPIERCTKCGGRLHYFDPDSAAYKCSRCEPASDTGQQYFITKSANKKGKTMTTYDKLATEFARRGVKVSGAQLHDLLREQATNSVVEYLAKKRVQPISPVAAAKSMTTSPSLLLDQSGRFLAAERDLFGRRRDPFHAEKRLDSDKKDGLVERDMFGRRRRHP